MATIIDELQPLVKEYADFDSEKKSYVSKETINHETRIYIYNKLSILLERYLISGQTESKEIDQRYGEIIAYFDLQGGMPVCAEIIWLEDILSQGRNNNLCLSMLATEYKKLTSPQLFLKIKMEQIASRDDLHKWVTQLKEEAKSKASRTLYDNLLKLMDESEQYFDDVGQLKPKGFSLLVAALPNLVLGLGAVIAAPELLTIYAVFFVLLNGGKIATRGSNELKAVGASLQNISSATAATTTTILVYLMRLVFWSSHQSYLGSVQAGTALLSTLKLGDKKVVEFSYDISQIELKSAEMNKSGIDDLRLRMIVLPLEEHMALLKTQSFIAMRIGKEKLGRINKFLSYVKILDKSDVPVLEKYNIISQKLDELFTNGSGVHNGRTADAVHMARILLDHFVKEINSSVDMEESEVHSSTISPA